MKSLKFWVAFLALTGCVSLFGCEEQDNSCNAENCDGICDENGLCVEETDLRQGYDASFFETAQFTSSRQSIGDPCYCEGDDCVMAGYQRPEQPAIIGCNNVPETYKSAQRVCLRSTNAAGIEPVIYFTHGLCTLMGAKCNPYDEIAEKALCSFAGFGDAQKYDEFTECPNGEVLLEFNMHINVPSLASQADLLTRICVPGCSADSDCRVGEKDPAFSGNNTGIQCNHEQGAHFCLDPRNYVSSKLPGSEESVRVVHPGNFADK